MEYDDAQRTLEPRDALLLCSRCGWSAGLLGSLEQREAELAGHYAERRTAGDPFHHHS